MPPCRGRRVISGVQADFNDGGLAIDTQALQDELERGHRAFRMVYLASVDAECGRRKLWFAGHFIGAARHVLIFVGPNFDQ